MLFLNPKRGRIRGWCWLEVNRVYINCFEKTVIFSEVGAKEDWLVSAKQVDESVQGGAELFICWQLWIFVRRGRLKNCQ